MICLPAPTIRGCGMWTLASLRGLLGSAGGGRGVGQEARHVDDPRDVERRRDRGGRQGLEGQCPRGERGLSRVGVAPEGAWLVEAGTVARAGGAALTALALAENAGGVWRPRELWLSPATPPTFVARGGAELAAVLGAPGPPLVRALAEGDRAIRQTGALPDTPRMAAALRARDQRTWTIPGLVLVGLAVPA